MSTDMNDNLWGWSDEEWVLFGREVEAEVAAMPDNEDKTEELKRLLGINAVREGESK